MSFSFTKSNECKIEVRRHTAASPWTYAQLDQRQRQIAEQIRTQNLERHWLISEVAPVITLGRRAEPERELLLTPSQFETAGIAIFKTDRGGLATYHGPGQWVVFCVDSLERWTGDARGVKTAVQDLLQLARDWAMALGVPQVEIREAPWTGVWTSRGKIASVGVAVVDGVVLHGLSFNVQKTPQSFVGFRPCGMDVPVIDYAAEYFAANSMQDPPDSRDLMDRAVDFLTNRGGDFANPSRGQTTAFRSGSVQPSLGCTHRSNN